jgi:hypothetical protein
VIELWQLWRRQREKSYGGENRAARSGFGRIAHHCILKSAVLAVSRRASLPKPCRSLESHSRTSPSARRGQIGAGALFPSILPHP